MSVMNKPKNNVEGKLTLSVREVAKLLGISRNLAYEATRTGKIPVIKFGKRVLIPRKPLEELFGLDKPTESIEHGDAWDKSDEVVQIEVKKPLDKVIPVKLSADKWEKLRQEARELDIDPTTLVRMWILDHLRERGQATGEER